MAFNKLNSHLIQGFTSGEVPKGYPYFLPKEGESVPTDENGNPRISWQEDGLQNNGRGRLIHFLGVMLSDDSLFNESAPDEDRLTDDDANKLFLAIRDLTAFMADLSIWIEPSAHPFAVQRRYRLYYPENVIFYQDLGDPLFVEYRERLRELDQLIKDRQEPPSSLIDFLTEREEKLFAGPENAQARGNVMAEYVERHLNDPLINIAVLCILYTPERFEEMRRELGLLEAPAQTSEPKEAAAESLDPSKKRLFSNSKTIGEEQWGVPKFLADNIGRAIRVANREAAIQQYNNSSTNARARKPVFKITNKETETEFIFDQEKLAIKTAEQFADQLIKIKDAKVLQTFFALMKWANLRDTATFREVPVSEIMELVLKANGDSKFNTPKRREFSEVLEYLASMTITVDTIGEEVNRRTGKGKPALKVERGVKVFRMEATYSVKKEFQAIPKDQLTRQHFDESVITRFSGELLPGKAHLFQTRASIYFDSLLHLDANKDSKAILLGFHIQTRFNQKQDKEQCLELSRGFLIDLCDYSKTNQTKPSKATQQIDNNLKKLKAAGIISKYSGLTNNDADRVKISPPKGMHLAAS